jgi:SAM-dependent methyltransferase
MAASKAKMQPLVATDRPADLPARLPWSETSRHLAYRIDEETNRFEYYENLWKRQGLALLLKHCDPSGKTLLDYGCGRGEFLDYASQVGFAVQGADTDPECVKLSSRLGPASQLNYLNPLGQFRPKSFDVVVCLHVLEHVENPKQVLSAIAKISREYVLLAVPNLHHLGGIFPRPIEVSTVNPGHLQSWDHAHLLSLAERHCGLQFVEWGWDATVLPLLSKLSQKVLGIKAAVWLDTVPFRKLFPYFGVSVLALFRPTA